MAMWFLILAVLPIVVTSDDPCHNYNMLNDDGGRSIKCSRYYSDSHDSFLDEGWRRVQLESTGEDLTMPTQCIPHGYCGSHSNVWLNGTHPTVEAGIVDRMGCLSMFSSCCHVEYPIQIKNCTDYMVYNLKRTIGDDQRYCFGDSDECNHVKTTYRPQSQSKVPETFPTKTSDYPAVTTTNKGIPHNHLVVNASGELPEENLTYKLETDEIMAVCVAVILTSLIIVVLGALYYFKRRREDSISVVKSLPTKA